MKKKVINITMLAVLCVSLWMGVASAAGQTATVVATSSVVPPHQPTTYYVDREADNASDYNLGTSLRPWLTIQHAAGQVEPGDTVIVVAGEYPERVQITRSGARYDPIIFQADGHVVTQGFTIEASYNQVIGFEITDTPAVDGSNVFMKDCTGVFVRGKGNQVLNNEIIDTTCVGIRVYASPVDDAGTSDNIIRGNRVERAKDSGIEIFGLNNRVENNEVYRTVQKSPKWTNQPFLDADGFHFHGTGHTFRGNHIHGLRFDDPLNWKVVDENGDPEKKIPHIDCFQTWNSAKNLLFEGNLCEIDATASDRFHYMMIQAVTFRDGSGAIIKEAEIENITIRNNIFHSNSTGFGALVLHGKVDQDLNYDPTWNAVKDVKIFHNTFVRSAGLGDYAIWIKNAEDVVVKNNIFYDHSNHSNEGYLYCGYTSTYAPCASPRVERLQVDANLVYVSSGTAVGTPYPGDLWQVDPEFVNFSGKDYHLQPISPAIDAGVDVGVANDFDGNPRPIPAGGAYDIGAYEAIITVTPTPWITGTPHHTPTPDVTRTSNDTPTPGITTTPFYSPTPGTTATPFYSPTPGTTSTPFYSPTPGSTSTPFYSPTPGITATPTPAPFFEDVPPDFWAYPYINRLYEEGYISGVSTDPLLFGTGRGLTRGEGAVFVVRGVEGADFHPTTPTAAPFADVPLSHWAVEWVNWLKRLGFTDGCGVNQAGEAIFCVDFAHARAEAAVYFVRMLEGADFTPPDPDPHRSFKYDDVLADNSVWYNKWIYWAKDKGIVGTCENPENLLDNLYRPDDTILREEAACMMYNAIYVAKPGTPTPTPTPTPTAQVAPIHDD